MTRSSTKPNRLGGTRRWRRATAYVLSLAAIGTLIGAPSSASAPATPKQADFEAASLASEEGISQAEAQQRLDWQEGAISLTRKASSLLGDDYGGVWIDADSGRLQLGVVNRSNARNRDAAERATASADVSAGTDVVAVEYNLADLNAASEWLAGKVASAPGGAAVPISSGTRPDLNAVVLHLPADQAGRDATAGLAAEARRHLGDKVRIAYDATRSQTLACRYPHCFPPLRGGIGIYPENLQGQCTGAFLVRSRTDRRLFQVTAGHCHAAHPRGRWRTFWPDGSSHFIGPMHRAIFGGTDAAIMRVERPAPWKPRARVYVTAGPETGPNQHYTIRGMGRSVVGARLCATGSRFGRSDCGRVLELNVSTRFCDPSGRCTSLSGLGRSSVCGVPGDSGAPMYANHRAYGILVGGPQGGGCGTFYVGMATIRAFLNVNVAVER